MNLTRHAPKMHEPLHRDHIRRAAAIDVASRLSLGVTPPHGSNVLHRGASAGLGRNVADKGRTHVVGRLLSTGVATKKIEFLELLSLVSEASNRSYTSTLE